MSLKDPFFKMSKSSKSEYSRINLLDSPDIIKQKIVKAKTDSIVEVYYDENRNELANLIRIFGEIVGVSPENVVGMYNWENIAEFKRSLVEVIVEELRPIREKTFEIKSLGSLKEELLQGEIKAKETAEKNMAEIKKLVGFF